MLGDGAGGLRCRGTRLGEAAGGARTAAPHAPGRKPWEAVSAGQNHGPLVSHPGNTHVDGPNNFFRAARARTGGDRNAATDIAKIYVIAAAIEIRQIFIRVAEEARGCSGSPGERVAYGTKRSDT